MVLLSGKSQRMSLIFFSVLSMGHCSSSTRRREGPERAHGNQLFLPPDKLFGFAYLRSSIPRVPKRCFPRCHLCHRQAKIFRCKAISSSTVGKKAACRDLETSPTSSQLGNFVICVLSVDQDPSCHFTPEQVGDNTAQTQAQGAFTAPTQTQKCCYLPFFKGEADIFQDLSGCRLIPKTEPVNSNCSHTAAPSTVIAESQGWHRRRWLSSQHIGLDYITPALKPAWAESTWSKSAWGVKSS